MTKITIKISDRKARIWLSTLRHHFNKPQAELDKLADLALHHVIAELMRSDAERMEKLEREIMNEGAQ